MPRRQVDPLAIRASVIAGLLVAAVGVAASGLARSEAVDRTPVEDLARVQAPVWIVNCRWDHNRYEERRFLPLDLLPEDIPPTPLRRSRGPRRAVGPRPVRLIGESPGLRGSGEPVD